MKNVVSQSRWMSGLDVSNRYRVLYLPCRLRTQQAISSFACNGLVARDPGGNPSFRFSTCCLYSNYDERVGPRTEQ